MNNKLTYVTAFFDIGRDNWNNSFKRDFKTYMKNFIPYLFLFQNNLDDDYDMIVYIDEIHYNTLRRLIDIDLPIKIIKINNEFLKNHIPIWNRLPRETEIMNSDTYKNLMRNRLQFPEHHKPKYTLINHAKIDFLNHAMTISNSEYLCWTDFGYFQLHNRIPINHIDLHKLDLNKINYTLINHLKKEDESLKYTLLTAPETIGGFFFFGNRTVLKEYQELYWDMLDYFDSINIADDDQHVALRCYFKHPELFKLHHLGGWHKALVAFQK